MKHQDLIIPKKLLIHGHYYAGKCRQAVIARWDERNDHFVHWRTKFGNTFIETIDYWTEDGFFDEFIPLFPIGPELPNPIPMED